MINVAKYAAEFLAKAKKGSLVPTHADWVRVRQEMVVHTRGVYPKALIDRQRPNEPDDVKKYRRDIYEPVTKAPIGRAIDSLVRILAGDNARIEPPEIVTEYLAKATFAPSDALVSSERLAFMPYMSKVALRAMIDDPNGVIFWKPINPIDNTRAPVELDESASVDITPVYVQSDNIYDLGVGVFTFKDTKQDVIKDTQGNDRPQDVFWIVTGHDITRLTPVKYVDGEAIYSPQTWYKLTLQDENEQSDFPGLPVIVLGGNIVQNEENQSFYESFFAGFVPPGNDTIRAKSDDDAVRVRMNFPIIEEKGQLCDECNGVGMVHNKASEKIRCNTCGGRGSVSSSKTPYSTFIINPPGASENPEFSKKPAISFLSPDVSILERSNKTWREFLRDAEKAVNLLFIEEAQSGVAKKFDREQKLDMLTKISHNFYLNIVQRSLQILQAYLVPVFANREFVTVGEPTNFTLHTQDDLFERIGSMREKGVPAAMIVDSISSLKSKLYNDDPVGSRISSILEMYDPLLAYKTDQINQFKAMGAIGQIDLLRHIHGHRVLKSIADELGETGFLQATVESITDKADEVIKALAPSNELPTFGDN